VLARDDLSQLVTSGVDRSVAGLSRQVPFAQDQGRTSADWFQLVDLLRSQHTVSSGRCVVNILVNYHFCLDHDIYMVYPCHCPLDVPHRDLLLFHVESIMSWASEYTFLVPARYAKFYSRLPVLSSG
jgi:hypothetical protein